LAKKYKTGGYDLDYLIEVNEEKTIAELFTEDGEEYFRKVESSVLKWFDQKKFPKFLQVRFLTLY
jgi:shikimate kinase